MVAFSLWSQIGRVVGISYFKSFTVVHMLGIWVSGKSRPCNHGFGGLDCNRMWRSLLLVTQFVSMSRTWTRLPLVCYSHCLYHITSLSTGPWTLSQGCLTLMGIIHFWFAWISLANCVGLFHAGQGKMSCVLLLLPNLLQWPPKSQASSSILGQQLFFSILGQRENHHIIYTL